MPSQFTPSDDVEEVTATSCNVLRGSDGADLVVAADFAATGRTTATFHDLVERLTIEHNIWEIAPVPYGQERGMRGADQAARWERDIRGSGLHVSAILGFCGGSVYAGELAERIGRWQEPPRLILIDPGIAEPYMLAEHLEGWLGRLEAVFEPDRLMQARELVREAAESSSADPLALADRLADVFRQTITPALVRAGHSPAASDDFTALVTGYLWWFGGAVQLDPRHAWTTATALNSETPGIGLRLIEPEERTRLVASAIYFDVPHSDMLRTPEVARTVDDLISAEQDAKRPPDARRARRSCGSTQHDKPPIERRP